MGIFPHERLQAYQLACIFVQRALLIAEDVPRFRWFIADQLLRAATSIQLNIAEGAAEFSPAEKARFYRMARRSAAECAAMIDALLSLRLIDAEQAKQDKQVLGRIAASLTRMIQTMERRKRERLPSPSPSPSPSPKP